MKGWAYVKCSDHTHMRKKLRSAKSFSGKDEIKWTGFTLWLHTPPLTLTARFAYHTVLGERSPTTSRWHGFTSSGSQPLGWCQRASSKLPPCQMYHSGRVRDVTCCGLTTNQCRRSQGLALLSHRYTSNTPGQPDLPHVWQDQLYWHPFPINWFSRNMEQCRTPH